MIIKFSDRQKIAKMLGLPCRLESQDWELEFADPKRIEEFLFIAENTTRMSIEMLRVLLLLILCSYNDYLVDSMRDNDIEVRLETLISCDIPFIEYLHEYWDVNGKDDDVFKVRNFIIGINSKLG